MTRQQPHKIIGCAPISVEESSVSVVLRFCGKVLTRFFFVADSHTYPVRLPTRPPATNNQANHHRTASTTTTTTRSRPHHRRTPTTATAGETVHHHHHPGAASTSTVAQTATPRRRILGERSSRRQGAGPEPGPEPKPRAALPAPLSRRSTRRRLSLQPSADLAALEHHGETSRVGPEEAARISEAAAAPVAGPGGSRVRLRCVRGEGQTRTEAAAPGEHVRSRGQRAVCSVRRMRWVKYVRVPRSFNDRAVSTEHGATFVSTTRVCQSPF